MIVDWNQSRLQPLNLLPYFPNVTNPLELFVVFFGLPQCDCEVGSFRNGFQ